MKTINILLILLWGLLSCANNNSCINYTHQISQNQLFSMCTPSISLIDTTKNFGKLTYTSEKNDTSYIIYSIVPAPLFSNEYEIDGYLDMQISNRNAHQELAIKEEHGQSKNNYYYTKIFELEGNSSFYACKLQYFNGNLAIVYFYDFNSVPLVEDISSSIMLEGKKRNNLSQ